MGKTYIWVLFLIWDLHLVLPYKLRGAGTVVAIIPKIKVLTTEEMASFRQDLHLLRTFFAVVTYKRPKCPLMRDWRSGDGVDTHMTIIYLQKPSIRHAICQAILLVLRHPLRKINLKLHSWFSNAGKSQWHL